MKVAFKTNTTAKLLYFSVPRGDSRISVAFKKEDYMDYPYNKWFFVSIFLSDFIKKLKDDNKDFFDWVAGLKGKIIYTSNGIYFEDADDAMKFKLIYV